MIADVTRINNPGGAGYWPKGMDSASQSASVDKFSRSIYPIWKGIEEKDKASEDLLTSEQVHRPGQVLFECVTLHKQDLAILNSGIKPSRMDDNQEKMDRLRQKAVRAVGV